MFKALRIFISNWSLFHGNHSRNWVVWSIVNLISLRAPGNRKWSKKTNRFKLNLFLKYQIKLKYHLTMKCVVLNVIIIPSQWVIVTRMWRPESLLHCTPNIISLTFCVKNKKNDCKFLFLYSNFLNVILLQFLSPYSSGSV